MSGLVDPGDLARRRRKAADAFTEWGIVAPGAVYAERPADVEVRALLAEGRDVTITGSRQSGKSSLVDRAAAQREAAGALVAWVDLGEVEPSLGESPPAWQARLARAIVASIRPDRRGEADVGAVTVADALAGLGRPAGEDPSLLVIDELDLLEAYPDIAQSLLLQLRAATQHSLVGPRPGVQVMLVGVKAPSRMLVAHSGGANAIEVGPPELWLDDLDGLDENTIAAFAGGFGASPQGPELARMALQYAGGYAHGASWACRTMFVEGALDPLLGDGPPGAVDARDVRRVLENAIEKAKREPLPFLQTHDTYITDHPRLAADAIEAYRQVLAGRAVEMDGRVEALALLKWSGLCRVDGAGLLRPRCDLLQSYFDRKWAQDRLRAVATSFVRRRGWVNPPSEKRVCLLTTGGTIGMVESPEGRVGPPERSDDLPFDEVLRVAEVTPYNLFNLDSADVGPVEWTTLAETIDNLRTSEGYDGFVVAHGTDTLAHTASAVSFALGRNLSYPVVFTGSQTTVDIEHGDARSNLVRATLVATQNLPEVVVCFGDQILRACRSRKKDDQRFDAFESPAYPALGVVAEEVSLLPQNFRDGWASARGTLDLKAEFADGILHIAQTPGVHASFYLHALDQVNERGEPSVRGIIVQSLGAANVPTKPPYDLVPLIRRAVELGIPVVVTSEHPVAQRNLLRYSPAAAAIEAGAIPAGNMTTPAVVAKLCWLIPQVDALVASGGLRPDLRHTWVGAKMQEDRVGEVSEIQVD